MRAPVAFPLINRRGGVALGAAAGSVAPPTRSPPDLIFLSLFFLIPRERNHVEFISKSSGHRFRPGISSKYTALKRVGTWYNRIGRDGSATVGEDDEGRNNFVHSSFISCAWQKSFTCRVTSVTRKMKTDVMRSSSHSAQNGKVAVIEFSSQQKIKEPVLASCLKGGKT